MALRIAKFKPCIKEHLACIVVRCKLFSSGMQRCPARNAANSAAHVEIRTVCLLEAVQHVFSEYGCTNLFVFPYCQIRYSETGHFQLRTGSRFFASYSLDRISTDMPYLLWDFDNTLAYRPGLWSQCLADLANAELPGLNLKREHLVPHLSSGFPWHTPDLEHHHLSTSDAWWRNLHPVLAASLVAGAGIDASLAFELAERVRAEYVNPGQWVVFADTEPTLTALSSSGWQHIVLSNHVPELPQLIAALGLERHFARILTSAALGYEKPHPLAFKAAVSGIPHREQVIMVGDSFVADYQGARAAGLDAVLVRNAHPDCKTALPDLHALVRHLQ
ncbi:HAD-IA family hydrolase [Janthinobacterium sp. 17J80-10]|uniref:HAD family hydrolase n=1 Tax=Janthinobacterium sp. 17J80-10 TaxID=2497863 RepID=UPI0013E8A16E|nr:HAD-IA family hydrolase [Janthinobacterium sp. 17J80-10]